MRKYSLNNYKNVGAAIVVLLLSLRGTLDEEKRNAACAAEALPQEVEKEWR